MQEFLTFRRMIMPIVIQVIFWLGILGILLASISFAVAIKNITDNTAAQIMIGLMAFLVLAAFGSLYWRLVCEVMILLFRGNETLSEIRREMSRTNETLTEIQKELDKPKD